MLKNIAASPVEEPDHELEPVTAAKVTGMRMAVGADCAHGPQRTGLEAHASVVAGRPAGTDGCYRVHLPGRRRRPGRAGPDALRAQVGGERRAQPVWRRTGAGA